MSIYRTLRVDDLSPAELADVFCKFDGAEHAQFFAHIWKIASDWPGAGWCQQSYDIAKHIDRDGLNTLSTLASHCFPDKFPEAN